MEKGKKESFVQRCRVDSHTGAFFFLICDNAEQKGGRKHERKNFIMAVDIRHGGFADANSDGTGG